MINIPKERCKAVSKYSIKTGKLLETYPSITIAARRNNIHRQTLNKCVVGKSNSCGGLLWTYAKDYKHNDQKICCKCMVKLTSLNRARKNFNICKECHKIYKSNRLNYIKDFLYKTYCRQKSATKKYGKEIPYTLEEFTEWISIQNKFFPMYRIWVKNKQNKKLTPHIARIDPSRSYSLDNIEVISEEQWLRKRVKPIEKWDKEGKKLICEYSSIKEASIMTGVDRSKITAVARNRKDTRKGKTFINRTGGGFKWKYSNKFQENKKS